MNTLDSVQKDNLLSVEIKEATIKGFAVAKGGVMRSTTRCREAGREGEESG